MGVLRTLTGVLVLGRGRIHVGEKHRCRKISTDGRAQQCPAFANGMKLAGIMAGGGQMYCAYAIGGAAGQEPVRFHGCDPKAYWL